ncbi:flagellar assembly protein FliH [Acidovorax sp. 56]|uniref:FliH/SctL family protein n=1 Tax=Acidovorax sp. 56 TaxID=2035205 RepID=UPI000C165A50|nr:FliH/SctL family protein [Acidovorax sp. 56]PIF28174.1 flagellar assembly protein FliH [Acidovorax sp. 56]
MSYQLTLHHDALLSVVTTSRVVPPQDVAPLQDALALLTTLRQLMDSSSQTVAAAELEAKERGYLAGYEAGKAIALEESAQKLSQSLHDLSRQLQDQRDELRDALVKLASGLVRCMAAEIAPEQVVTALAVRALEQVVPPQPVRLRLPPSLMEGVRAQLSLRELPLSVQCLPDPTLEGLTCVVESQAGALLAGLDDMLAHATQQLEVGQRQVLLRTE